MNFFKLTIPQRKTGQKYQHSPPFRNSTFFLKPLRKNNFETPLRKSYHGGGRGWILHGMVHIKTKVLTQHFSSQKFLSKTSSENSYRGNVNITWNGKGPVARSLVSANRWLRGIKMYRFPWYLTLVCTNHASSNPGQVFITDFVSKCYR